MKLINLVIICLVIILLVLIAPKLFKEDIITRSGKARPKMTLIEDAIDAYHLNTNQYPVKLEDLLNCPKGLEELWKGPYLKESQLYDPWERPYIYDPNGKQSGCGYDIISFGADGVPGGNGKNEDILND